MVDPCLTLQALQGGICKEHPKIFCFPEHNHLDLEMMPGFLHSLVPLLWAGTTPISWHMHVTSGTREGLSQIMLLQSGPWQFLQGSWGSDNDLIQETFLPTCHQGTDAIFI